MAVGASCSGGGSCDVYRCPIFDNQSSGVPGVLEGFCNSFFSLSVSGTSVQIFSARFNRVRATATLCAKG